MITLEPVTGESQQKDGTTKTIVYGSRQIKLHGRLVGYTNLVPGGNISMIFPRSQFSESEISRIKHTIREIDFPDDENPPDPYMSFVPEEEPDERAKRKRRRRKAKHVRKPKTLRERASAWLGKRSH